MRIKDEEREQFMTAMHQMRDSFAEVRQLADWEAGSEPNSRFFDGYAEVKRLWRNLLLLCEISG